MSQIIIHSFTKTEIEALDFKRFDAIFGHWPQLWNRELREKFNSLVFMADGYNEHEDEIYCIPEVRRYYQELHKRWPWWCFFLNNMNASMAVAYLCLLDTVDSFKRDESAMTAATFDPRPILEILRHDFSRMNYLWEIAGMSDEANDRRTDEILEIFCGLIAKEGGQP